MLLLPSRFSYGSVPENSVVQNPRTPHFETLPLLLDSPAIKPQARVVQADTNPQPTIAPQPADVPPTADQPPAQPATTDTVPAPATPPAQEVMTVPAVPPQMDEGENAGDGSGSAEAPTYTEKQGTNGKIIYVTRPEDSKLIVELVLDDRVTVLTSELEAWQVNETLLIPLGKFAELLRFPIKVDTGGGVAGGWFISPENKFSISYPYKTAIIAGKSVTVPGGIVETHLDDIYVSLEALSTWFPVKLTLNYNELRLYLKTLKELPFEAEARRKSQWEALQKAQAKQPGLDYDPKELIKLPYRMYAAPVVQLSHGINLLNTPAGNTTTTSNGIVAQTDLLGMSAHFSANMQSSTKDREQLTGVNLRLSKEDYDGGLLGLLHATRYEMGDISSGAFPLAGQQTGRGAVVTNQPYNFVSDANAFRISGFGPVGWDVEVFQDNDLLAFGHIAADGRYNFDALPLSQGFNLFKVILYGPSGEQETRYERFYLGQNMVPAGELYYNASALQSSTPIVDVSASPAEETSGTMLFTGEYGVTKYLSAMAGYYRGPIANTTLDGIGFGLRTSGGSTYAQMNTFYDKSGGQSSSVLITGNLTDTASFNFNHTLHYRYDPGVYTVPKKTAGQVSNLFDLHNDIIPSINVSLGAAREVNDTGQIKLAYTNRISTNFLGLSLTNELEKDTFSDATADTYIGSLSARYRSFFGILHGDLSYHFMHPFELNAGSLTLQKELTRSLTLNAGLGHTFGMSPITTLTTGLDWKLPRVRLGFAGSVDSHKNRQIGVTMTYTLVPQSLSGNYTISGGADDLNTGRLILRPFEDLNGDGIWQAGEPLVKDVAFRNLLRGAESKDAGGGLASLGGLTPNLANRVTADEKSVTDLSLRPAKRQLVVLGRSGVNGPIDFPFSKTGDISGTLLYPGADGQDTPLENIRMLLLRPDGKQVSDTYSEYDGYFAFEGVPLGTYKISFPASPELQAHYAGDGSGPSILVGHEHPDVSDLRVRVEHDRILLLNDSAAAPEVKDSSAPDQKSAPIAPLPFPKMPINTNEIKKIETE
ncbi:MAG: hypothetical protein ACAH83_10300 [Alphaproteobacteria bacterium]